MKNWSNHTPAVRAFVLRNQILREVARDPATTLDEANECIEATIR